MHDFDAMAAGTVTPDDPQLTEFIKFYRLAKDFDQRNANGAEPILPCLKQIDSLSDFADLQQRMPDWIYDGLPLPFSLDVDADMKNTKVNALFAQAPGTILPDKTYYDEGNQAGPKLLAIYAKMMTELLQKLVTKRTKHKNRWWHAAIRSFDRSVDQIRWRVGRLQ